MSQSWRIKIGLTLLFFIAFSMLYSWKFALVILVFIAIHENGHLWAMRKVRLRNKGMFFIPFLGAAAVATEPFRSRKEEVFIAIMGPIWGLIPIFAILTIGRHVIDPLLCVSIAGWAAMINLFNLMPIGFLDGGRIFKSIMLSIHPRNFWICLAVTVGLGGIIFVKSGIWVMPLIVYLSVFDSF